MSKAKLPRTIDPYKFAEKRLEVEGLLPLEDMKRLIEVCHSNATLGEVKVWMEGNIDVEGLRYLHGKIKAEIPLICQRCLDELLFKINAEFYLSPVTNEAGVERLPSNYDELRVVNNEVSLSDLVEDEILLALPVVAKHDEKQCRVTLAKYEQDNSLLDEVYPFAKLAQLKIHKDL